MGRLHRFIRGAALGAIALSSTTAFAFTYTDQDLLLVFRKDGANDVIYDLGPVSNFLGLANGTQKTVTFDKSVALAAYHNSLSGGPLFSLMATTSGSTPIAQRKTWVSSGNSADQPLDPSPSVLANMGALVSSVGRNATQQGPAGAQAWSVPSSSNTSYTYVMTGNGTNPQTVDLMGGYWAYNVAGTIPSTVRFFQVIGSNAHPKPAPVQVGSFTISTAGALVFTAGSGPVGHINATPVLPSIAQQAISELSTLTVTNTATDSNSSATLTYALVNPPAGASINSSGIITWTPTQAQSPSTNTLTTVATATDALDPVNPVLKSTNSFQVIVKEVNAAPVLPSIANKTVNELSLLTVTNAATDSNIHSKLSYALVNPPSGAAISAQGVITWTPSQSQSPSTNLITTVATATNAFDTVHPVLKATNSFTVVVKEVNAVPVLPTIAAKTVNELALLTVTNTATESNIHSKLSYALVNPPAGAAISSLGIFTWTPTHAQSPSTNIIKTVATATDSFDTVNPALKATNTFTVIVKRIGGDPTRLPASAIESLAALGFTDGEFSLKISGAPGASYMLQAADALSPDSWQDLQTIVLESPTLIWSDKDAAPARRFYRLKNLGR